MRVAVLGLWHLGSVTAACLAAMGHEVVGFDPDEAVVEALQAGTPPVAEPGLAELIGDGSRKRTLRFTSRLEEAFQGAEVAWVTFDTPVDEDDRADVAWVEERVREFSAYVSPGTLILVSSQVPVGTTARLERDFRVRKPGVEAWFGYSPENLRLGKAIGIFSNPDRVVVGLREPESRPVVERLLGPIAKRVVWMGVESAEMTKHAINAFLANSVAFINEIASLCESMGADAKEVERGLKTEERIGPKAYLSPGGAYAGGTLARDVEFLSDLGTRTGTPLHLLRAIRSSNDWHRGWARRRVASVLGTVRGRKVAVWGLTYKPGTDTLRRSSSVELCCWLASEGATVVAHDPAIVRLPPEVEGLGVRLATGPLEAVDGAHALVVATEWPVYRDVAPADVAMAMPGGVVIDANGFLIRTLGEGALLEYFTVGRAT